MWPASPTQSRPCPAPAHFSSPVGLGVGEGLTVARLVVEVRGMYNYISGVAPER